MTWERASTPGAEVDCSGCMFVNGDLERGNVTLECA
jgi:hypothetical protein